MRYYFSAQITVGTPKAKERYAKVIDVLTRGGHINTNYLHLATNDPKRISAEKEINSGSTSQFDYLLKVLNDSDALICDVTEQSSTVGFQIMHAVNNKIPCLALQFKNDLQNPKANPSMIFSHSHTGLLRFVSVDSLDQLDEIINSFCVDLVHKPFKFNFYLPLNMHNELARAAAKTDRTKSELVRDLIAEYLDRLKSS